MIQCVRERNPVEIHFNVKSIDICQSQDAKTNCFAIVVENLIKAAEWKRNKHEIRYRHINNFEKRSLRLDFQISGISGDSYVSGKCYTTKNMIHAPFHHFFPTIFFRN